MQYACAVTERTCNWLSDDSATNRPDKSPLHQAKKSDQWRTKFYGQINVRVMRGTRIFELGGPRGGNAEGMGAKENCCYRSFCTEEN